LLTSIGSFAAERNEIDQLRLLRGGQSDTARWPASVIRMRYFRSSAYRIRCVALPPRKDGSAVDVLLTVSPLKDSAGRLLGASKIARDITERKRMEQDLQLLLREIDHRAKNLLALIQATVELSHADTTHDLKAVIGGRIQALARVHTLLAESRWAGADLATLVAEELSPYRSEQGLRADISGPDVRLEPSPAQSIAMVFHELTTNAVKYGALSVATGRVRIDWSRASHGRLMFRWVEMDGPSTDPPKRDGLGTRVITQIVRHQLSGDVRFDWRAEGLVCELALPSPTGTVAQHSDIHSSFGQNGK
jgi:two-component sensor histidine kinase